MVLVLKIHEKKVTLRSIMEKCSIFQVLKKNHQRELITTASSIDR